MNCQAITKRGTRCAKKAKSNGYCSIAAHILQGKSAETSVDMKTPSLQMEDSKIPQESNQSSRSKILRPRSRKNGVVRQLSGGSWAEEMEEEKLLTSPRVRGSEYASADDTDVGTPRRRRSASFSVGSSTTFRTPGGTKLYRTPGGTLKSCLKTPKSAKKKNRLSFGHKEVWEFERVPDPTKV